MSVGNCEGTHLNWVCIIIWGLFMWGFVCFCCFFLTGGVLGGKAVNSSKLIGEKMNVS